MSVTSPMRYATIGLDEFREQAIRAVGTGLLAAAVYVLWLVAAHPAHWYLEMIPVLAALVATSLATHLLLSRGTTPAAVALLLGLTTTITACLYSLGSGLFAAFYPVVALVAGMLLGWACAAVVAIATGLLVLGLAGQSPDLLTAEVVDVALLLTAVNLALSWLLSRPVQAALDWSWASYAQALEKTEEARSRQAELARLSKSLEEACWRLEVTNQELERARRVAVEARRLKAEFAATISHELRTPLNLIIGFSEMMVMPRRASRRAELPEAFRGDVEAIYRNACHLSSLIDDVLELSQVEAHRLGFKREPADLRQIVGEAMSSVEALLRDRGLSVTVDIASNLPVLHVDQTRIRQVLINLLVNAARFTIQGGVAVAAVAKEGEVIVSVADTGVGIPPQELPRVFEEFHQIESADRGHHSGLGLTICKRLVELHGGTIWVESTVGQGSTFYFSLPSCENVASVLPDGWETWAAVIGEALPAVVVLGDDEEAARLLQRFLDRYQVVCAADHADAVRLARRHNFQAIVAVGAAAQSELPALWERGETFRALPAFICPLRTVRSIGRDLGVSDYLTKPVTRDRLRSALQRVGRSIHHVLVIDDDPEMVRLLRGMIRAEHRRCRVGGATSGKAGLEELRRQRPDLVLLDLLMPGVDGYAVLEAMRADESLREVPVIVISAKGAEEEAVTAQGLHITRRDGLSVGELVRCLQSSLDLLVDSSPRAPAQPTGSAA